MSVEKDIEGIFDGIAGAVEGMGKRFAVIEKQELALMANLAARGMNGEIKMRRFGQNSLEFNHGGVEYKLDIDKLQAWVSVNRPDLKWWATLPTSNSGRPVIKLN